MNFIQKIEKFIFNVQKWVHYLLDPDSDFWYSKLVNSFIIATIILDILAVTLESEPNIRYQFRMLFENVERFSLIIFTLEYFLRFWSAPASDEYKDVSASVARWRYTTSFFGLIDLIAIAPFFLAFFIPNTEALRIIQLFRAFKLMRYNAAMNTLLTVVKEEARDLLSVIFLMGILLIIASSGIYLFEHKAQPEHFGSILRSMWWAIVTITTVGYGENVPVTVPGRIFAGMVMVISIGIVALPAGILASAFSEQLGRHKTQYRNAVQDILSKGNGITSDDRHILKSIQNKCNLSDLDANNIYREVVAEMTKQQQHIQAVMDSVQKVTPQQPASTQANTTSVSAESSTVARVANVEQAAQNPSTDPIPSPTAALEEMAPVPKFCTQCGAKVNPGDKYCSQCGHKLSEK
ncbi:ion transporter [Actinobacillus delphinicola]|uniref:MlotiK1 channel n=1 Tax=Actinobacillus delphinicola TaxID=51161 RepID=A0A448TTL1_9PAST|nr:ion transporter [Actinobacillus delphinicola]VEJ09344.1 MlotiK1 channel [Actinobacillus delphinicola]